MKKKSGKVRNTYREIDSLLLVRTYLLPPQILLEWLGSYTMNIKSNPKLRKQSLIQRIQELADSSKSIKYGVLRKYVLSLFPKEVKEKLFFMVVYS